MSELKIWAPAADKVEVELNGKREEMFAAGQGWWALTNAELTHGTEYVLWINGEGPFPDPRSFSQPRGVHGPSRWIDHELFQWSDGDWNTIPLANAIIYELHIGTFTQEGTFTSAIPRLDKLKALGITHIQIMPVAEFAGERGWGYDGVDLYAPHHSYGGPEGLKQLIDACHHRKMGVILDVVYNHLGPEGNYLGKFAPYFHELSDTPWGKAVNLDGEGSEFVRRFFIDNALMWLRDYHCDGLRVDATHAFVDRSKTHFLAQFAAEVKALATALDRDLFLIAESDLNDPRVVRPPEEDGWGFDAQGNEDFHHALHTLLTGENFGYYRDYGRIADLAKVLSENFCLYERFSEHRQKIHGCSAKGIESSRFIAFTQNHDQTGNRARGERLGHLVTAGQVKLGAAVTLLGPFIPMLFQGEEWSASAPFYYFADPTDPGLRDAIPRGRLEEFALSQWDPSTIPDPLAENTWKYSQLNWEERDAKNHHDILAWYCALLRLRKQEPDFAPGPLDSDGVVFEEELGWLSFRRGRFRVVCNFSNVQQLVNCCESELLELVMASEHAVKLRDDGIMMPGHSVAVVAIDAGRNASVQGG